MKALGISALIFAGVLMSAVGWLVLNPDPMAGEPSVTVAIEAAAPMSGPAPERAAETVPVPAIPVPADPAPDGAAVAAVEPPPKSAPPSAPPASGVPPQVESAAPAPDLLSPSANPEPEAIPELARPGPPPTADRVAAVPVPPALKPTVPPTAAAGAAAMPFGALLEQSRYGPLPKIASDGRRPADVYAATAAAVTAESTRPRVAILINGLGLSDAATGKAIDSLPGAVTLGFGAYGRNLPDWVARARAAGHEIMLQIPLEPYDYPDNDPGPHTLLTTLPAEDNVQRLRWLMSRFTGYVGVTNHMGAKFVTSDAAFLPVLEEIKSRGLVYLDDGAAARSAAGQVATGIGLPFSVAQVQLDAVPAQEELDRSLAKLEALARERGLAIAVGSALPITVDRLHKWIDELKAKGITLLPISAAIRAQHPS